MLRSIRSVFFALIVAMAPGAFAASAIAGDNVVEEFNNRDLWDKAVGGHGNYEHIEFTDGASLQSIEDHYLEQYGVTFPDNTHWAQLLFLNDGWGFKNNSDGGSWMIFDSPKRWLGADHVGTLAMELYNGDKLIYTTGELGHGGAGHFSGIVSEVPFDGVFFFRYTQPGDPPPIVVVDDLYFEAGPHPRATSSKRSRQLRPGDGPFSLDELAMSEWQLIMDLPRWPWATVQEPDESFSIRTLAMGTVTEFTDEDAWFDSVGDVTTIKFTDQSHLSVLNNQFATEGLTFSTEKSTAVVVESPFFIDGHGFRAGGNGTWITFDTPQDRIAVNHNLKVRFNLYYEGDLIYASSTSGSDIAIDRFFGVISDQSFDMVHIERGSPFFESYTYIDDLHFGPPVLPGDLTGDGTVGVADLLLLIDAWGPCDGCGPCPADLNGDCTVGVADLLILISNWG